jgi:hypothetical protein
MPTPEVAILPINEPKKKSLGPEIDLFTKHTDTIGDVLLGMVFVVHEVSKQSKETLRQFEAENCEVTETDTERTVKVSNTHAREWKRKMRRLEHFELSKSLLPRSLLVSLISQYDAYLGRLIRTIFIRKPEILNGSDKKISFESLSQFLSIDAAREYILEKEVESILRSSHSDQFKWMERTFDVPLTKGLESWPEFVEITERRNLFVHTDGIVSSQYISVCKLQGCTIEESTKEGARLGVPEKYFEAAHQCIYEIGVKLGQVLWRKLFPDERIDADNNFARLTYDLIDHGKYEIAIKLLDFGCTEFKKFSSEANQLSLTVNRAQAYKWSGDEERCKKIMRAVDWSAKGDQFKLADAVLSNDWDRAGKVMKRIGKDGPVERTDYRDWPLFQAFRKHEIFLTTYLYIFGEDFTLKSEIKNKDIEPDAIERESEIDLDCETESNLSWTRSNPQLRLTISLYAMNTNSQFSDSTSLGS